MLPMNFPLYKATMDVYSKKNNNDNFDFVKSESFKAAVAEAVQQAMGDDSARRERHGLKTSLGKCNKDLKRERTNSKTAQIKIAQLTEERDRIQKELAELRPTIENDLRNEREARQLLSDNLKDLRRHLAERDQGVARDVAANEAEIARLRQERGNLETQLAECRRTGEKNRKAERIALDKEREAKDDLQRLLDESRNESMGKDGRIADFETELAKCRETVAKVESARESERHALQFIEKANTIMTAFFRQHARGRDADYSTFPGQIDALASEIDSVGVGDALKPLKEILISFGTTTEIVRDVSAGIEYLLKEKRDLEISLNDRNNMCNDADENLDRVNAELKRAQELLRKQTEESEGLHAEMSHLRTVVDDGFDNLDKKMGERLERFVADFERKPDDVGRSMSPKSVPDRVPDSVKKIIGDLQFPQGSPRLMNLSSPRWNEEYMKQRVRDTFNRMLGMTGRNLDDTLSGAGGVAEEKSSTGSSSSDDGDDIDFDGYNLNLEDFAMNANEDYKKLPSFKELGGIWDDKLANELRTSQRTTEELLDSYTNDLLDRNTFIPYVGGTALTDMYGALEIWPSPIGEDAFDDDVDYHRYVKIKDGDNVRWFDLTQTRVFRYFVATRRHLLEQGHRMYIDSREDNVRLFLLVASKTGIEFWDDDHEVLILFSPDSSASSALSALFPWLLMKTN